MEKVKIVRSMMGCGTFGILSVNGHPECLTLERPWKANEVNVSCVPPGEYICKRIVSRRFGETFEVTGVTGRTHILFHRGNTISDSKGCILLGSTIHTFHSGTGVAGSGNAMLEFMILMDDIDEFELTITC